MNTYKNIILGTLVVLLFSSCYDLDRYPYDKVVGDKFWKNETQVNQAAMGVYNAMKNEKALGVIFSQDCLSDIGIGYDNQATEAAILGTYNPRTNFVEERWQYLYDGGQRANLVIRKIPEAQLAADLETRYVGEAKFMRALYYFYLMNYFGGLPLYDESVVLEEDYNNLKNPRSTLDETRLFILKDLEAAIKALPVEWGAKDKGRATKGAAYALRGKVYLYAKNYEKAALDFREIVEDPSGKGYNYSLLPNYADLFKPGGDASNEMIFAIQNSGGAGMDYGMPMTFYMGTRSSFGSCWNNIMPSTTLADMYEWKDGKPFNWDDLVHGFNENQDVKEKTFKSILNESSDKVEMYTPSKDLLLKMYTERDPRMEQSLILPYTKYVGWVKNAEKECEFVVASGVNEVNGFIRNNKNWDSYLWRKFVAEGNMGGAINNRAHTPINFPLIRYADVLLMLAECENELGNESKAIDYINQVRQRPSTNMPKLNSGPAWLAANGKQEIFKRIVKERAIELAAEGHRFNDIRRWNMAKQLLNKDEYGFTGKRLFSRKFEERDMLWPIPAREIEMNGKLKQNPGWY